ncbi:uncharacterized protein LOC127723937 [Mytilus californianus]|uniref:uncharacterized protein LOC127723937 n=1 Tax=Mytilus californianus TaxID=6549 RepID=UPI0022470CFC|nr:uncharacterized protein LOC127723937 [Mytilus californianus]
MSPELRSICGLGFPPKTYTQNPNECINKVIKEDLTSKCDAFDFAKKMEVKVKQQENEIKLALIGKGEYTLKPEYSHLKIEENLYWRKTSTQREAVFKKLLQAPLTSRVSGDDTREKENILSMSASDRGVYQEQQQSYRGPNGV